MTDESDRRKPLSSEEMLAEAHRELDRRPSLPEMGIDRAEIEERVEEAMPTPAELVRPPRPTARGARRVKPSRVERTPPAGFGDHTPQPRAAISVAIALALLVMGLAVFLAVAASSSGG